MKGKGVKDEYHGTLVQAQVKFVNYKMNEFTSIYLITKQQHKTKGYFLTARILLEDNYSLNV